MGKVWVRKAIIPATGLGTRFLPVTKAQAKEILQNTKPGKGNEIQLTDALVTLIEEEDMMLEINKVS